jgi:hypothetical protein
MVVKAGRRLYSSLFGIVAEKDCFLSKIRDLHQPGHFWVVRFGAEIEQAIGATCVIFHPNLQR